MQRWIFIVKLPFARPRPQHGSPSRVGWTALNPDYCAVDHLQTWVATATFIEGFERQLPQARQRPAHRLAVNGRPLIEMFVKITSSNIGPRDPENPIKNKATIPRLSPVARTVLDHKWLKAAPILISYQTRIMAASSNRISHRMCSELR
jgi:hypothetical protein